MTITHKDIPPGRRLVAFATPTLTGMVTSEMHLSMLMTQDLLQAHGIIATHLFRPGDPYLAKVRTKIAIDFLRDWPQATDIFWIDDDVSWPAEKVLEFLMRPEDVVAGIYPKKSDTTDFPVELLHDDQTGEVKRSADGKLIQASMVPTGFLRIRRPVMEALADKAVKGDPVCPHCGSGGPRVFNEAEVSGEMKHYPEVFRMGLFQSGWWGEDYKWCDDWKAMGGEIWVDPDILFTHRGQKKWAANMSEHLGVFEANARTNIKALAEQKAAEQKARDALTKPGKSLTVKRPKQAPVKAKRPAAKPKRRPTAAASARA